MIEPWSRPLETDVLVIGGGIFGCATAYHAARFGLETVVVDRADLGAEASSGNAGSIHLQLSPSLYADKGAAWRDGFAATLPFFVAAVEYWRSLANELPRDIELRLGGGLMVADSEEQMRVLEEKIAIEQANGLAVELLSRDETRGIAPYLSDHIRGAAYCAAEGKANPLAAVAGLAEGAELAGARLFVRTEVTAIEAMRTGWEAHTSRGVIRSRRLVIAAGLWSAALAAMAGLSLPLTHRPIHVNVTEACAPFIPHLLQHAEMRLTLKQALSGNVIIGGGWPATIDAEFGRPAVLRESIERSLWIALHVVPQVGGLHLLRTWACRNLYTPDGATILGPVPGKQGLHLAVCNTFGFTLGPLCGLVVAEQIAGLKPSNDPGPFSIGRFGGATACAPA